MPALSPTMTEGSISSWKFKEGDTFKAGDVLLEIQTDKAAIDVEAQDDGVLGKILVQNDTSGVQVGATIALLAEEGDDLSAIEIPTESSSSSSPSEPSPSKEEKAPSSSTTSSAPTSPPSSSHHVHPTHTAPLLPSVLRLLSTNGIKDATIIKPTGHKGMLTKGDVLAHLGLIKNPKGSEKDAPSHPAVVEAERAQKTGGPGGAMQKTETPKKEMDGPTFRQLIAFGLKNPTPPPVVREAPKVSAFDTILSDYSSLLKKPTSSAAHTASSPSLSSTPAKKDAFDEILGL